MTAEVNGVIEETRFQLDKNGKVKVYYRAHEEDVTSINIYIRRG